MSLDDIVNVSITTGSAAVSKTGFGIPLIVGTNFPAAFTERARSYTSTAGMVADTFAVTHPAYLAAQAVFSQNPKVKKVIVGRCANKPTMIVELTPVVVNSTEYTVTINGTEFSFTSDASATAQEIVEGLSAAINLGAEPVTASEDNAILTLTADVAGDLFTLEVDRTLLTQKNVTADPGIVADLQAIQAYNDEWYAVCLTSQSEAEIDAAAAHVESLRKIMLVASADDAILTSSSTDVASDLETAGYARTMLMYHPKPHQYAGAAWAGVMLPKVPGSATWKFKTLRGVDSYTLSSTEVGFAEGKNCAHYQEIGGIAITQQGKTASGEFMDVTNVIDKLHANLQERIYSLLANANKVPFTDAGIALVESEVRGALLEEIKNGGLANDPEPTVSVPLAADVSTVDKANRLLPDVEFTATLAGAIHSLEVTGTISV